MMRLLVCALAVALCLQASSVEAAAVYSGGAYSQNFDTLPNTPHNGDLGNTADSQGWIDDTAAPAAGQYSIVGWYIYHPTTFAQGGVSGHQRLRPSGLPTTSAAGSYYAYGEAAGNTERALGVVPSVTLAPANGEVFMGVRLTNNTPDTLRQFTFNYTGEQWRVASTVANSDPAGNQQLTVDYRLGGTDLFSGSFTEIPSATFDSPVDVLGATNHLNGNDPANRVTGLGATVTGIDWAPGSDLWLRWTGINEFGTLEIADHGLAIDDFSFSAQIPEPASLVMVLSAICLFAARRQR